MKLNDLKNQLGTFGILFLAAFVALLLICIILGICTEGENSMWAFIFAGIVAAVGGFGFYWLMLKK